MQHRVSSDDFKRFSKNQIPELMIMKYSIFDINTIKHPHSIFVLSEHQQLCCDFLFLPHPYHLSSRRALTILCPIIFLVFHHLLKPMLQHILRRGKLNTNCISKKTDRLSHDRVLFYFPISSRIYNSYSAQFPHRTKYYKYYCNPFPFHTYHCCDI